MVCVGDENIANDGDMGGVDGIWVDGGGVWGGREEWAAGFIAVAEVGGDGWRGGAIGGGDADCGHGWGVEAIGRDFE